MENNDEGLREFFRVFFFDILSTISLINKRESSIDDLFEPIDYTTLEERMDMEKFRKFVKITSDRIKEDGKVNTRDVEYIVQLNVKKGFKITSIVKFNKISVPVVDWVRKKLSTMKRLDDRREDIIAFASYAPVSAASLRMNIYKFELRNISLIDLEDYLKKLVHLKLMKKTGVSNRYVPR